MTSTEFLLSEKYINNIFRQITLGNHWDCNLEYTDVLEYLKTSFTEDDFLNERNLS